VSALVTPFKPDESIDYEAWPNVIKYLIGCGIDGQFAVGTGGEFYAMTEPERREALRFVMGAVGGKVPVNYYETARKQLPTNPESQLRRTADAILPSRITPS
jgi:dihydrodipicolinate synthase/N-acetylneuraminate lyase